MFCGYHCVYGTHNIPAPLLVLVFENNPTSLHPNYRLGPTPYNVQCTYTPGTDA